MNMIHSTASGMRKPPLFELPEGSETAEETEETEWSMEMDLAEGQEDDGIEE